MSLPREVFVPLEGPEHGCAIAAIENAGLEPSAFLLEERSGNPFLRTAPANAPKIISVKSLTTGTQHLYNTSRGGGWPHSFERDLRGGCYGTPILKASHITEPEQNAIRLGADPPRPL